MKTKYCLGFLFSFLSSYPQVVLIEKKRPEWQRGKLNGVGGKVEAGELPIDAMRREFEEETGLVVNEWTPFAEMIFTACDVICYAAQDPDMPFEIQSMTDERVSIRDAYSTQGRLPNLRWLIPMALSRLSDPKQGIIRIEHL